MKTFLKNNWYYLVIVAMLVIIVMLYKKPAVTVVVEDTKKIEQLRRTVDSLVTEYSLLQSSYNSMQNTTIDNTITQNKKNAKKVNNIPTLSDPQRDSMWSTLSTSQDSVPGGYWDILKPKTRD